MDYEQEALKKLQTLELQMLEDFAVWSEERGLEWWLDSGSCLGAIRHGGFIPWDDDMDIGMLRETYDCFLAHASQGFIEGYCVRTFDNTDGYAPFFAKICKLDTRFETQETNDSCFRPEVFLDVFPYDHCASSEKDRKRQQRQASFWQKVSYLYHSGHIVVPAKGGLLRFLEEKFCLVAHYVVRIFFSRNRIKAGMAKVQRKGDDASQERFMLAYAGKTYPEDMFVPVTQHEFGGSKRPCPARVEDYLEKTYGDWRCLPAEENRTNHCPIVLDLGDGVNLTKDAIAG